MVAPDVRDADRAFALLHVPSALQGAVASLWALDEALGHVVASTREPMLGQMRLTWWHDALSNLSAGARRGEPVLDALAAFVVPTLEPAELAALVEGWEVLLEPLPLDDVTLAAHADRRGERVFALTGRLLAAPGAGGRAWALADFARRCSDPATRERAWSLARASAGPTPGRLPRPLRILARLAAADAHSGRPLPRTRWRLLRATL